MAGHAPVRDVREGEVEAVLALWREAYGRVGVTDTLDDVLQAVSGSTSVLLVAEEGGRIVGTVIGGFDGWRGNIYRLAVHPQYRRQGLARRLVSDLEARQPINGVRHLEGNGLVGRVPCVVHHDEFGLRPDAAQLPRIADRRLKVKASVDHDARNVREGFCSISVTIARTDDGASGALEGVIPHEIGRFGEDFSHH